MANTALIEDLRKQFAENPRRVFARLANEYRKAGDLDVAIEICRAHVPLQPTYISGYIVLGQALFERGQPDEARATFETALGLDPENLIALRQLGDIARETGDIDAARGWYHKLLEVDPQNDDIAAQLDALNVPQRSTASVTAVQTAAPAAPVAPAQPAPVSWSDIHPDSATVTPLSPQAMRPRFTIGVIPENDSAGAAVSAVVPVPEVAKPAPAPAPEPIDSVLPEYLAGYDRHAPTPPAASPVITSAPKESAPEVNAEQQASHEVPSITDFAHDSAPVSAEVEDESHSTAVPSATTEELAAMFGGTEPDAPMAIDTSDDAIEPEEEKKTGYTEEPYDPTIGRMLELHPHTSTDALLPDLMMTESGAELLREQGHVDQAIYVYRHLAAKNPSDTSYAERIAALERGAHSSIPLVASISDDIISAARNRPYSTQNVRSFFTSFATRRPPEPDAHADNAEPSAESAAAPSAVPVHAEAERVAPAVEAHAAPEPAAPPEKTPDVPATAAKEVDPIVAAPMAAAAALDAAPRPDAAVETETTEATEAPAANVKSESSITTVSAVDRSALESLFASNGHIAATDEAAATKLASVFSADYETDAAAADASAPAGQPTRAASDAISLDDVFQSGRASSEHKQRASQPAVSFDQFFANRENGSSGEAKSDTAVETASHRDDSQSDLELFHEWLDGLKK